MDFFSTNLFDLAIYFCLFVAVVMGFMTGLLRSLAPIFGYVFGVAVAAAPKLTPMLNTHLKMPRLLLLVLVLDRIIPPGREPGFLKGSQRRPILSSWGQYGLQSLPPDVDYIDRLKRQRRISIVCMQNPVPAMPAP